jgi:hypothetical protein
MNGAVQISEKPGAVKPVADNSGKAKPTQKRASALPVAKKKDS